ncbi:hypothetical protein [Psychroserpens algicola]|uniref:DUF1735 domain-containing protein n=1 Tax=Psychroserpens algicola TaxID=1719034 RepID=A0ABT0H6P5_9FLAO|nr:hypothetical protein [Psychroserpens algicola]MCK8480047.1 hypothetical protein [Psychroserpens algicola]
MKTLNFVIYCLLFFCVMLVTSCVSDTDFEQAEDILPTPTFESSLIFSNLTASNFVDSETQQEVVVLTDTTRLEYINSDFFVDQLLKTNLTFQFTNSLDRNFNIDFEFVNDANELQYLAQVQVPSGQIDNPVFVEANFLIEEPELSTFEDATTLIYKITLPPTTAPIEAETQGILKLESRATFYFEL